MTTTINTMNITTKSINSNTSSKSYVAHLFSSVLETEVSTHQALLLIHAFCAWFALMLSAAIHPIVSLLMLIWFVASIVQIKRSGLRIPQE